MSRMCACWYCSASLLTFSARAAVLTGPANQINAWGAIGHVPSNSPCLILEEHGRHFTADLCKHRCPAHSDYMCGTIEGQGAGGGGRIPLSSAGLPFFSACCSLRTDRRTVLASWGVEAAFTCTSGGRGRLVLGRNIQTRHVE
jgi:hypothetical protein